MKIKYDGWRWIHDTLAFLAIGLALYHMFKVNHYMALTYQKVLWLTLTGIWLAIILYISLDPPDYNAQATLQGGQKLWKSAGSPGRSIWNRMGIRA